MTKLTLATLVLGLSISGYADADDNTCVELARTIGMNYANYLSSDEQHEVAKADMCSESYSSATSDKKAQIAAAYSLFSGSASYTDGEITEAQAKHCEGKFGDYWRNQLKTSEQRTVSAEAASILNTCLAMNVDALYPTIVLANSGQEVAMTMQFKPSVTSELKVAQFGPSDLKSNACKATKDGKVITLTQPDDVAQTLKTLGSIWKKHK